MQLAPYIYFYGRCEEALAFYKDALGGSYEFQRNSELPPIPDHPLAEEFRDKIMHATFTGNGMTFMCSDGAQLKTVDPEAGNINLSLAFQDRAAAGRAFAGLAAGGTVAQPLADAFWGGQFGSVTDKFGIEWMVVCP
jgi:PhnB protein